MIIIESLTKRFKELLAVNGVCFEAKPGEIFGLLGPNGAGKTTTLRLLCTVLRPTSGSARVAGYDIIANSREVRQNIGVLTATIGLYGRLTARENVEYFGALHGIEPGLLKKRLDEVFKMLEMEDFANRRTENFSTGMKQKVAIARAIIHDPPVIMFDEPTAGLDVLSSRLVKDFMMKARGTGKCVLLSTHLMFEAEKLCDRAAIIHKGKIVACGTIAELKVRTGATDLEGAFIKLVEA